jgi:excisionase family DNA binding protein
MATKDETMTVEEAAVYLKVDAATVQRELKAQRLPGNKVGRAWRIHREDLRVYLKGQKRDPRQAMEYAALCFDKGDFNTGLSTLVGALGYDNMPRQLGLAMTKHVALLIDAREATDPKEAERLAQSTRWASEGPDGAFQITYFSPVPGFSPPWTINLPDEWNKMLDEFLQALWMDQQMKAAGV